MDDQSRRRTVSLLRSYVEGDDEAIRRVYDEQRARVLRRVRGRLDSGLRRQLDAEDVFQAAIASALAHVQQHDPVEFEQRGSFLRFVTSIAMRTVVDEHRARTAAKRGGSQTAHSDTQVGCIASRHATPSELMCARELEGIIRYAIAELSEDDQRLVALRESGTDGRRVPFKEVGRQLGISAQLAKLRHSRAWHKVRDRIKSLWLDDDTGMDPRRATE